MMVLLHKTAAPDGLRDYRPISLIHSVGKLIAKGLALRLAPFMPCIVKINQSAFIRGRQIPEILFARSDVGLVREIKKSFYSQNLI
jgi:hypothetical protein